MNLLIMRMLSPIFVLSIMLLMSLSPLAMNSNLDESSIESATGPKSLIDFEITSIEIGNQTRDASEWTQPDGSIVEYQRDICKFGTLLDLLLPNTMSVCYYQVSSP